MLASLQAKDTARDLFQASAGKGCGLRLRAFCAKARSSAHVPTGSRSPQQLHRLGSMDLISTRGQMLSHPENFFKTFDGKHGPGSRAKSLSLNW